MEARTRPGRINGCSSPLAVMRERGRKIGTVDFGHAADAFDESDVTMEWYDYLFKGINNRFATGRPVKIFVMGKNEWREEAEWPLSRAKSTPTTYTRTAERIPPAAMELFPPEHRKPSPPTATFMIRRTQFPPRGGRFVAIAIIQPGLATSRRLSAARMCWCIRLLRLPRIQKLRVR